MLLLDEPLAALDAKLREELQIELINLQKEVGIAFVYVTHDQTEALALSHRIAVMNQGRVEQLDEPSKIYGFPRTRSSPTSSASATCSRDRSRRTTAASSRSTSRASARCASRRRHPIAVGAPGTIALRPEKIRIAARRAARTRRTITIAARSPTCCTWATSPCTASRRRAAAAIEALLANSQSGRAKFFEVGDAVEMSWHVDAGHFIAE